MSLRKSVEDIQQTVMEEAVMSLQREHDYEYKPIEEFYCSMCGKSFPSEKSVVSHEKRTHRKPEYLYKKQTLITCEGCGGRFRIISDEPIEDPFRCPECVDECVVSDELQQTTEELPVEDQQVEYQSDITEYIEEVYIKEEESPDCENEESQDEIGQQAQDKEFKAVIVEPIVPQVMNLVKEETKPEGTVVEFFCDICGKSLQSAGRLKQHIMLTHQKALVEAKPREKAPKKLACDYCDKVYSSVTMLRFHTRVHTGEKPFQCTACPKSFAVMQGLQIHSRMHTGERPFPCSECTKAFRDKAALNRHIRVHTGVKPYGCTQCGKYFTQSNSLKLHIHTVHLGLPTPYKSRARREAAEMKPRKRRKDELHAENVDQSQVIYMDSEDAIDFCV